jgi:hypothetical protein
LATDQRVLSTPVIVACGVLTVLLHLAPNGATVEGSIWVRIAVASVAYLPGLGLIAVFVKLTRNLKSDSWRITLMLFSFFAAGALRGLVLSLSFFYLGMADSLHLDFRIPASALPFGLAIAVATYAVVALDQSRSRISSLRALERELEAAVAESNQSNSALRERTLAGIEEDIRGRMAPLQEISASTSAEQLRSLAADVVRPLSHALSERVPRWQASPGELSKIRWRDIFNQLKPELSLQPGLLTGLSLGAAVTAFLFFFGFELAVPMLICSAVAIYFATRGMNQIAIRLGPIPSLAARALLMTGMLIAISLPAGLVNALITLHTADPTFALRAGVIVIPLFGWFIALGGAAQRETARIEGDISRKIDQLTWLRARLNLINWVEQGELARVLHGPVQSAISKGVIRLKSADELSAPKILMEVKTDIADALSLGSRWSESARPFEELLSDLSITWSGICKIDISVSPRASSVLTADAAAGTLAWDVVHEACNNAVQHGKANWISVRVTDPHQESINIEILDNGSEYQDAARPGFGTNMIENCAISWGRHRVDGLTQLQAELPIVP